MLKKEKGSREANGEPRLPLLEQKSIGRENFRSADGMALRKSAPFNGTEDKFGRVARIKAIGMKVRAVNIKTSV
jgi:hypothetical protein